MIKSHQLSSEIPFELQIEILMRLPVKSLMRFKSVSKLWSSLICSQDFTNRFLKVSSSQLRIYMWLGFGKSPQKALLSASSSSPDSDLSFIVDDQDLTIPAMEGYKVSQVFRCLMCLVKKQSAQIYNAITRQLVVLPNIKESKLIVEYHKRKSIMYQIGHDPVHNQYKVVCTVSVDSVTGYMTEIWVLVLGGDGSRQWRKISSPFQPHYPLTQSLTINGRLHYIACVRWSSFVLVSLDISSEEISILQKPEFKAFRSNNLIEYGGRVALLDHRDLEDEGVMKLLVMENSEYNSWTKKTLVLHPSQRDIIDGIRLRVQGTTRNGEVIFVPKDTMCIPPTRKLIVKPQSTILFHVFLYNIQNNLLRKVEIKETSNQNRIKIWTLLDSMMLKT